ncbi:hypothetical protein GQ42DRAFT_114302, partial [Ramicandelaber brevisporus]
FSSDLTSEEAASVTADFASGYINVVVATSGFGVGLDFEGVIWTIHYELPYSLIDYVQQIGRAGR